MIESAQQEPTANLGFWRHYVRLERVYNATEVREGRKEKTNTIFNISISYNWYWNFPLFQILQTICMCVMTLSTMYSCVKANSSSGGGAKKKKKQQQQQSAESSKDAVFIIFIYGHHLNLDFNIQLREILIVWWFCVRWNWWMDWCKGRRRVGVA